MTRRAGESYEDFVLRAGSTSRTVKLADLKDNIQIAHIAGIEDSKYRKALDQLMAMA
jgi:hypothetical protein